MCHEMSPRHSKIGMAKLQLTFTHAHEHLFGNHSFKLSSCPHFPHPISDFPCPTLFIYMNDIDLYLYIYIYIPYIHLSSVYELDSFNHVPLPNSHSPCLFSLHMSVRCVGTCVVAASFCPSPNRLCIDPQSDHSIPLGIQLLLNSHPKPLKRKLCICASSCISCTFIIM